MYVIDKQGSLKIKNLKKQAEVTASEKNPIWTNICN